MSSYNRYSHHALRALTHAGLLVRRFHHPRLDTGHLLVGVMLTKGSIGHRVLSELDLQPETAEQFLETLTLPLVKPSDSPPNDAALDIALELAADEARWLGHHYIGTEHLLLGITRTNVGNADDLLHLLGIPPDQLRRRVRVALSDGAQEFSMELLRRSARLSELSRRVINAAEQMAIALDHPTVGIGHLLSVLEQERRSGAAQLLKSCHLDDEAVRWFIEQADDDALFSIESVLMTAGEFAQDLGIHYTGTEHLLLALLSLEAGWQLLEKCGGDPNTLINLLRRELGISR